MFYIILVMWNVKIGELFFFFFGNDGLFGEYEIRIFKFILINCNIFFLLLVCLC